MRDPKAGTYNEQTTYCPVNAYGDCLYCDQCGVCHIDDPLEDCTDWYEFWESWEDWERAEEITDEREDFADEEIQWAMVNFGYKPNA